MIIFDFIFYSMYTLVPRKAFAGKRFAVSLLAIISSTFLIHAILYAIDKYCFKFPDHIDNLFPFFAIPMVVFTSLQLFYFRRKKLKQIISKFRNVPKWVLKTMALLCMISSYVVLVFVIVYATIHKA
jgi:Na+/H+ antiporter NhaD/arsenite permease-like protein